jgi:hypothetical protein
VRTIPSPLPLTTLADPEKLSLRGEVLLHIYIFVDAKNYLWECLVPLKSYKMICYMLNILPENIDVL